ncbi:CFI-box-CTERM domain-containing protein [Thermodesulfobacteriota bacterium]
MLFGTGTAVVSGAVVSGAIENISGYSPNIEPDDDITINLRNLMTWQVMYTGPADAIGHYILDNIDQQSYWIELIVADVDGQAFPFYTTGALLNVTQEDVTQNFTMPTMVSSYTLTINIANGASEYVVGDEYTYSVMRASDYTEVAGGTATAGTIQFDLAEGTYRFSILADNYEPYEYCVAGDYEIFLDEPLEIDATLTTAAGFKSNPPVVEVTHEATDTGFALSVVKENFTDTFAMAINNVGAVNPADISGAGTADNPYIYNWTTAVGPAGTVEPDGDITFQVEFTFKDGANDLTDYLYTVTFIIYASEANAEADKPEDLKELEEEYDDQPTYIILGEKEFLPMKGGIINVKVRDYRGGKRDVAINIPPIPSSLLFIDDYPDANNNLDYVRPTDRYDIPNAPLTKTIAPTDILKLKVKYYHFGPGALANGVSMKFVVSRGPNAGARVRYNPIPSASVNREHNAPKIVLPMMLNPNSRVFRRFARLSQAKGSLCVLVSERGDGRWFHVERLPFTVQDDGLMLVQVHHLTTVGVQEAATAASEGGSSGGCFIATAAYGSYFEDHVMILRQLRDDILLHSGIGKAFVAAYYKTSPPIADFIADHDTLRAMVRWGLAPVVGLSWVALNHGTFAALALMMFMLTLVSGFGVALYRRRKQ